MKFGDQVSCPASTFASGGILIWGNRNAPSGCPKRESLPCGPQASRRQYHKAKTRILVAQRDAADSRSSVGDSLCAGKAALSKINDTIIPTVTKPITLKPKIV